VGFGEEWLSEVIETEMSSSLQKQKVKIGENFTYHDILCTICSEVSAGIEFTTG
jgi:hypothetical protein